LQAFCFWEEYKREVLVFTFRARVAEHLYSIMKLAVPYSHLKAFFQRKCFYDAFSHTGIQKQMMIPPFPEKSNQISERNSAKGRFCFHGHSFTVLLFLHRYFQKQKE
jgi:hypothetical protein